MRTNPQRSPRHSYAVLVLAAIAAGAGPSDATTQLTTTRVASGLVRPVFVTAPPGDTNRLFIVEQRGSDARGRIKILKGGALLPAPFLTTDPLSTGSEQGLLGLAFAPDYATSRRFYIHYTDAGGTTRLERRLASGTDPDVAEATGTILYSVAQPFANHNGGWIDFGPDGYLYMALGDGGSGGDPGDRAQNIQVPLGKILRFDVSGPGPAAAAPGNPFYGAVPGLDEIWSFGLRNPWRCSIDRTTGDLVIVDVGQGAWEEIDFAPAESLRGRGWNYGWRCFEGNTSYTTSTTTPCGSCAAPGCVFHFPAHTYDHTLGRCSVTGGYVYRGCKIPDLEGTYFFADFCGNQIYSGKFVNGVLTGVTNRAAELAPSPPLAIASVASFGEDASGELYLCDLNGGEVFAIVPRTGVAESDMPVLQVATAAGDTLGATTPGNALAPGITPFADAGSRIRSVGYLASAQIRACTERTGDCLASHLRLFPFDIDATSCVDPDSATLTRTFVFRNASTTAQPLCYVDIIAPYLGGDPDLARAYDAPTPAATARLAVFDATNPTLYVAHRGFATDAVLDMDADLESALVARVAADQPLTNRPVAGPARVALALGFDFGSLGAAVAETVVVVTRLLPVAPVGVEPGTESIAGPSLRALGSMPFGAALRLRIAMPEPGAARLEVFDVRGRRVRGLLDGVVPAGSQQVEWDGRDDQGREQGAGLYFVRLRTGNASRTLRVVRVQ